jgi:hypothetical protein
VSSARQIVVMTLLVVYGIVWGRYEPPWWCAIVVGLPLGVFVSRLMRPHRPARSPAVVTLADAAEDRNFVVGMPLVWDSALDRFRRETWRDRVRQRFRRLLWWRRVRFIVTAVDAAAGTITQEQMRWSWLRWKWVRP